eukprot:TRINITY_DN35988_c0_g1_i2.p1 TRINITY_DN35988_c0_g1~~TRINITY_DN35988_c0_g1_i2.p1  ORF type:complete len:408 (+),score=-6.29 TRINITY_DN35988_c0_g1_i2:35-1225(+)
MALLGSSSELSCVVRCSLGQQESRGQPQREKIRISALELSVSRNWQARVCSYDGCLAAGHQAAASIDGSLQARSSSGTTSQLSKMKRGLSVRRQRNMKRTAATTSHHGSPSSAGKALFHRVELGETLWSIARMYGVSVTELIAYNRIDNVREVYADSVVIIPLVAPAAPFAMETTHNGNESINTTKSSSGVTSSAVTSTTEGSGGGAKARGHSTDGFHVASVQASGILNALAKATPRSFKLTQSLRALMLLLGAALLTFVGIAAKGLFVRIREYKRAQWVRAPEPQRPNAALKSRTSMSLVLDRLSRSHDWAREDVFPAANVEAIGAAKVTAKMKEDGEDQPSPEEVARDYEEIRRKYQEDLEASYQTFLRDTGSQAAGRFRGGMPSKFRGRKPQR